MLLNGNLSFKLGQGEIQNAIIERVNALPTASTAGRIVFLTVANGGQSAGYYYDDGSAWQRFATGNNADLLAAELDNIETASGGLFSLAADANAGKYNATALSTASLQTVVDATSLAGVILALSTAQTNETSARTSADATLTADLAAEVTRATTAEGNVAGLTTSIGAGATDLAKAVELVKTQSDAADATLTTNLAAEVTRATTAEGNVAGLTTSIGAGATDLAKAIELVKTQSDAADATQDGRLTAIEGSYIKKDGSVAFTGDQSLAGFKLTNVGAPTVNGDAANKEYVDGKISALGNAFEYVGVVDGGVDAASAFDLETLTVKHAGAYYKVATTGYFKVGTDAAFYVNAKDGLIFNTAGKVDIVDNTNSQVQGVTNFVAVTGNSDTGFTVDLDTAFKGRVSTLESDLAAEITNRSTGDATLTTNLAAEVTRATAAEGNVAGLATSIGAGATDLAKAVELVKTQFTAADATLTADLATEVTNRSTGDATLQSNIDALSTKVGKMYFQFNGTVGTATFAGGVYTYTVSHNLGQKYCNVTIVDQSVDNLDQVIIPQSIKFVDANTLEIAFNVDVAIKAVVMGLAA